MARTGIDYAWHTEPHPTVPVLKDTVKDGHPISFVVRYVAAGTGTKVLTRAEATRLRRGGIDVVAVFESTAGRMAVGRSAGVTDASWAKRAAVGCGMPAARPIYYAADSEAVTPSQAIAYCLGVRSVTGPGTVGVYGSYYVVRAVAQHWAANFPNERVYLWQTRAWSNGNRWGNLDLWQGSVTQIDRTDCDWDTAYTDDFGQWDTQAAPEEDIMASIADLKTAIKAELEAEREKVAHAAAAELLEYLLADPMSEDPANPVMRKVSTWLRYGDHREVITRDDVKKAISVATDKLSGRIVDVENVLGRILSGGSAVDMDILATKVADKLAERLKS